MLKKNIITMKAQMCLCCGERLFGGRNDRSRHGGICPSCSSLLDGMELPNVTSSATAKLRADNPSAVISTEPSVNAGKLAPLEGFGIND